jgi:LysR family transcriptional regulator, cys regulon transcriptional activator
MNFQQLRSVREAVRCGYNLTEVAAALHTSQPGVSRQVRELEEELGVELFVRSGKRLLGLTSAGQALLPIVERVLLDADSLRRAGQELQGREEGRLSIAATHSQARYALPHAVRDFRQRWPRVTLHLHQGSPKQVAEMLISGEADIGIATEALAGYDQLVTLPCYRWSHSVVLPPSHPLLELGRELTLQDLARYPIITYEVGYTGRSHIDAAFAAAGLQPDVVLTAMDADVIKTYVELEMGVGIVASIAVDEERDRHLRAIDAGHLFQVNVTRLGMRRELWLPGYAFGFIETFVPTLTRDEVLKAFDAA